MAEMIVTGNHLIKQITVAEGEESRQMRREGLLAGVEWREEQDDEVLTCMTTEEVTEEPTVVSEERLMLITYLVEGIGLKRHRWRVEIS